MQLSSDQGQVVRGCKCHCHSDECGLPTLPQANSLVQNLGSSLRLSSPKSLAAPGTRSSSFPLRQLGRKEVLATLPCAPGPSASPGLNAGAASPSQPLDPGTTDTLVTACSKTSVAATAGGLNTIHSTEGLCHRPIITSALRGRGRGRRIAVMTIFIINLPGFRSTRPVCL